MSIIWNTGPAAERARHNLKLNKNKKIKRTPGPKLQAPSPKKDIIERYNKRMKFIFESKTYKFKDMEEANKKLDLPEGAWFGHEDEDTIPEGTHEWRLGNFFD
jgi:hypothetical protein